MERDTFDVEVRLEVEFVVSVTQPWRYDERVNMAKRRWSAHCVTVWAVGTVWSLR
jgi:hypothetical protein